MREKMTRIILLACLAGLFSLSAMAAGNEERKDSDYIIGQGDVLLISVWKDESLTREVVVLPDGTISFPLIGTSIAEGRTVDELKNDIVQKINRFVPDPVLSVAVKSVNSMYVYVIGRVNSPGRFFLNSNVNVLQALAMAGGLTPFAANNSIKIIRNLNGISSTLNFRYGDVAKGTHLEQNVILKRGDVIVVP
jgi:polysaccharide biosynthesis/export protein